MQTLPFIEYGFQLYDVPAVKQLIHNLPLKLLYEDHKKDKCIIVNRVNWSTGNSRV